MTTTDANGIVYLQDTDDISPFHTLINVLQSATSNALDTKIRIVRVANATARDALTGASPTTPIYIHQIDTGQLLVNTGSGFKPIVSVTAWTTITSFSANFTADPVTPKWRINGDRIELDGVVRKSGAVTASPENMCNIGASGAPVSQKNFAPGALFGSGSGQPGYGFLVAAAGGQLQVAEKTATVDRISLSGAWYPLT